MAIPGIPTQSKAPNPDYNLDKFHYQIKEHTYICPQGHTLKSNGKWYQGKNYRFRQFKTSACKTCPVRALCTTSKVNPRIIQRSEYQQDIERNRSNIESNPALYKQRQAIVEHIFGTIKRQWNFHFIHTKKFISRAEADVGLMFTAYNIRRLLNLVGIQALLKTMRATFDQMGIEHLFYLGPGNFNSGNGIITMNKMMRLEVLILASKRGQWWGF